MKVISEKRTEAGCSIGDRTYFEMITDVEPNETEVAYAQIRLQYHPAGYGGPWSIQREKLPDGTFKTTWCCSGSCD